MKYRGLILIVAVALIIIAARATGRYQTVVKPEWPPIPSGAVYYAYFDDLTLTVDGSQVFNDQFTGTSKLDSNDLAVISREVYHSKEGSLQLRQELDHYSIYGKATHRELIKLPEGEANVTVWFMVPRLNTDAYVAGHSTSLKIVAGGEIGFNATIVVNVEWNKQTGQVVGLGLVSRVNIEDPRQSESIEMDIIKSRAEPASFDEWHSLNIVIESDQVNVLLDGILTRSAKISFGSIKLLYSVELAILPHYYV